MIREFISSEKISLRCSYMQVPPKVGVENSYIMMASIYSHLFIPRQIMWINTYRTFLKAIALTNICIGYRKRIWGYAINIIE